MRWLALCCSITGCALPSYQDVEPEDSDSETAPRDTAPPEEEIEQPDTTCVVNVRVQTDTWGNEVGWSIYDASGVTLIDVPSGEYQSYRSYSEELDMLTGRYTLELRDASGDGWNGAQIELIYKDQRELFTGTLETGASETFPLLVDCIGQGLDTGLFSVDSETDTDIDTDADTGSVTQSPFVPTSAPCAYTLDLRTAGWGDEIGWSLVDPHGHVVQGDPPGTFSSQSDYRVSMVVYEGDYVLSLTDRRADGWHGGQFTLLDNLGTEISSGAPEDGTPSLDIPLAADCPSLGTTPCDVTVALETRGWPDEIGWRLEQADGTVLDTRAAGTYTDAGVFEETLSLAPGHYVFVGTDAAGDGWHGGHATVTSQDAPLARATVPSSSAETAAHFVHTCR